MIRLEGGILVLDAPISKEDAEAVGEFAKHVRQQEMDRIIGILDESIKESESLSGIMYPAKVRKIIDKIRA